MSGTEDRRAPGATRIPFDALVEVGGALGPSFEAQAINVSEDGILLRTAYLPEPGQPLTCRFDGGPGKNVLAAGEVIWAKGEARGGEFGVRFTDVDAEGVDALKRLCGVTEGAAATVDVVPVLAGSKVRLHIDGLASPMRAKIKDSRPTEVTVGSDLGFLQVGKALELEDAQSGGKRAACIDRVDVAIDPTSHVPQLVVTLRYSDAQAEIDAARGTSAAAVGAVNTKPSDDLASMEEASAQMKGAFARQLSRVGPAVERLAARARMTVALLAKRRSEKAMTSSPRTTAPAPGGGLHSSGRRVIRGEAPSTPGETSMPPKLAITKRRAVVAGAVMTAAILGAVALKKTHHEPPQDGAANADQTSSAPAASASALAEAPAPAAPTAPAPTLAPTPAPMPDPASASPGPMAAADEPIDGTPAHKKHLHVAPFGNGPVHHGNVLHLKLDGPIESIEGAQQPTGFAVKIPGRKAVEAAAPLAARDSRIAAIKVSNGTSGADLTVAFKDGVPNYQVSAKGDTLVISLAPVGAIDKVASKDVKGDKSDKPAHHRHEHDKSDKKKTDEP
jgi:hypothetical protein